MATQGPLFPGTTANLSNAGTSESAEAWVNPGNIVSDNATEAQITAATYDSPDISQILVASNFGFSSVSGTVNGITVEIDRRSIIASSGKDFRVQLAKGTTFASLVGNNKAVPATIWPTTSTVATYGSGSDLWGASFTAAEVAASSFAVFLSCQANIANADVGVDYIRVTVTYTPPTNTTVTPDVASLTLGAFAPTASVTANQTVTPGTTALTSSAFAPAVTATDHKTVTSGTVALVSVVFAPTVTASDHKLATPSTTSLALTSFVPQVTATAGVTVIPGLLALSTIGFAPQVSTPAIAIPSAASLELNGLTPLVETPVGVMPEAVSLGLVAFAPTVLAGVTARPTAAELIATGLALTVTPTANTLVSPWTVALTVESFAPSITGVAVYARRRHLFIHFNGRRLGYRRRRR